MGVAEALHTKSARCAGGGIPHVALMFIAACLSLFYPLAVGGGVWGAKTARPYASPPDRAFTTTTRGRGRFPTPP
jgi:hypothetical protein